MDSRTIRLFITVATIIAAFVLLDASAFAQTCSRSANASASASFRVRKSTVDLPDRVGGQGQNATVSNVEEVNDDQAMDEVARASKDKRGVTVAETGAPSRQGGAVQQNDGGKQRPYLKNAIAFVNN
jgi:hypothetical protein